MCNRKPRAGVNPPPPNTFFCCCLDMSLPSVLTAAQHWSQRTSHQCPVCKYDVGKVTASPTTVPCSLCPCRVRKYFVRRYAHHLYQGLYAFGDPAVACVDGMMGYTRRGMRRAAPAVALQVRSLYQQLALLANTKAAEITSLLASAYLTLPCLVIHAFFLNVTSPIFLRDINAKSISSLHPSPVRPPSNISPITKYTGRSGSNLAR